MAIYYTLDVGTETFFFFKFFNEHCWMLDLQAHSNCADSVFFHFFLYFSLFIFLGFSKVGLDDFHLDFLWSLGIFDF